MDSLTLCVCGHVGKIQGLGVDRYGRETYRFSLCANFRHGKDKSELWLQCRILEAGLLQLILERGIYTSEKLLIVSHEATLASALYQGKQTAFLNCLVDSLTFLTEVKPDAIVRTMDGQPRIVDRSELVKSLKW